MEKRYLICSLNNYAITFKHLYVNITYVIRSMYEVIHYVGIKYKLYVMTCNKSVDGKTLLDDKNNLILHIYYTESRPI